MSDFEYYGLGIMIVGLGITACFAINAHFKAKAKELYEEDKFNARDDWEGVGGNLERLEVPGGWIYRDYISGHSIALTFVPKEKEPSRCDVKQGPCACGAWHE